MRTSTWKLAVGALVAGVLSGCGGNSAPGPIGVTEQPLNVTNIAAGGLLYDAKLDRILAIEGAKVSLVNPANGQITGSINLHSSSPVRQISTGGEYLYVGGSGTTLERYDLSTGAQDQSIDIWPGISGPESSAVGFSDVWQNPNQSNQVLVQRSYGIAIPEPIISLAVFTDGLPGPTYSFPAPGFDVQSGCFNAAGSTFFAIVTGDLVAYGSDLTELSRPVSLGNYGTPLSGLTDANGKLLYGSNVYSEQTLGKLGQFGTAGQAWASIGVPGQDAAFGFCQGTPSSAPFMAQVDLDTCAIVKQWPLPNLPNPTGYILGLTYAGPNRIAMLVQDKADLNTKLAIFTAK